ncbi:hypothetical protein P175DRAFT_0498518 [Aspergillus ochraceoroseus IBT 24754]|uniref:Uncharacterized protein n=2 Tax=Aspergillus ochraceoroseus TaxID=138278 RepID=A0A2T5MA39_9EURO|nr:uncharacterized protein P175DRAFT_0498518 [Aspergillus ochraceoroseus IBT 24754]KKK25691.1 hypothetical protein AOCH_005753 [Aspergillus ochraceoroseus]PTU25402.1 hypothetical protein P175DRAFT_0498518 [Aspergillus ochraceoroseus IBT 24754]
MGPVRRIVFARWVTDFLQYILDQDTAPTLLIVCSTRDFFLEQLVAAVHVQSMKTVDRHKLLTKTLGLLSKSSKTQVVFCPTVEHLRAYISTSFYQQTSIFKEEKVSRSLMAILNPISLHFPTLEFSAQGLSRTLANAVEAASRNGVDLVLCECRDALDPTSDERGEALWYIDVPLLSNSLRKATEGSNWTGRMVPLKRVVERWFQFTGIDQTGNATAMATSFMEL